ncbi:MAG: UDP-N-acetylmuramoylalanine--D-glutamate ligase [Deltaproteobacteria bacterium RBG_19FT_COMBO_43_11]|nr:MAG: UDP-N-acetylmuramoylalanine--D-glutamate ligase [Deltaproteobacteria bacterium RBG_19FT_COMBO_43_11]
MNFNGKKIVVIGMGKTGIATARFLASKGAKVAATDEKPADKWGTEFELIAREKWLEIGKYNTGILADADMVVPSPGVPPSNDLLVAALKMKMPVISEIELAYRFLNVPIIAVTGTNGKTTTTTLLGKIFEQSGKKIFVGGNIGNPLIGYVGKSTKDEFIVAEVSSFQLQWVDKFRPCVSILLNVTSDHINYHGSFAEYLRIKSRVLAQQTADDLAILNAADPAQKGLAGKIRAKIAKFNSEGEVESGIFLKNDKIIFRMPDFGEEVYPLDLIKLPGMHNVENVMAAIMAARFCGCPRESINACVADFHGLPHRIEFAGEKNSVKFYDDSKGTNVGSVVRALDTFAQPVILLLGGRDKDVDFETLKPKLTTKTKNVILFGEEQKRIASLIGDDVPKLKKPKLRDAIEVAYKNAKPGDIVLLSPGCASFDEFKDYKERGDYFKEVVRNL